MKMTKVNLSQMGIKSFNDTLIKELPQDIEILDIEYNQISSFKGCENLPKNNLLGIIKLVHLKVVKIYQKTLKYLILGETKLNHLKVYQKP